ncbi:MAG: hypothetical protein IJJ26_11580 [Victivallales bacterium]|nr:hypothetical protein [Victivallales bacterium]
MSLYNEIKADSNGVPYNPFTGEQLTGLGPMKPGERKLVPPDFLNDHKNKSTSFSDDAFDYAETPITPIHLGHIAVKYLTWGVIAIFGIIGYATLYYFVTKWAKNRAYREIILDFWLVKIVLSLIFPVFFWISIVICLQNPY